MLKQVVLALTGPVKGFCDGVCDWNVDNVLGEKLSML